MKRNSSDKGDMYVTLDLCRLPPEIGCHLANGHVELCEKDTSAILGWVAKKVNDAPTETGVIVEFVSWCPPWLAMSVGAHLYELYLNGKVNEVRFFTERGGQHNILDKTGIKGISGSTEMAA
ncbi:MAG: hypothetical protein WAX23_12300 [Methanosarcina sp.]